jgi:hypothetical protein
LTYRDYIPSLFLSFLSILPVPLTASVTQNAEENLAPTEMENPLEQKVRKALGPVLKGEISDKNPLAGLRFEAFESAGYLFYYRAKISFSVAKRKPLGQRLILLRAAQTDLKTSLLSNFYPKDRVEELNPLLQASLAEELLHHKRDFEALQIMGRMPNDTLGKDEWFVRYAAALWRTHQRSSFKRLVYSRLSLFKDDKRVANLLGGATPPWKDVVAKYEALADAQKIVKTPNNLSPVENIDTSSKAIYAAWKAGEWKQAETLAQQFLKNFPAAKNTAEVWFDLARIQEDQGDYARAAVTFADLAQRTDVMPQKEHAFFRKAWVLYLGKQHAQAAEAFAEYTKAYPEGDYYSTSLYFRSRALGKNLESKDILDFAQKYPLNFYTALMAFEGRITKEDLLKILPLERPSAYSMRPFHLGIKDIARLRVMSEMKTLNMQDDLFNFSNSFSFKDDNADFMLHLLNEFIVNQDVHHQILFATKLIAQDSAREMIGWSTLFPKPFEDALTNAIKKLDAPLSSFFLWSIIRQESAFNVKAISAAQAYGLMQLIDSTAKDSATRIGLKDYNLLLPQDNVLLGTKTIMDLIKRYPNRLDLALAAYNAGSGAVDRWLKARGHLEPLEFIESIPYNETRVYVKSILRNIVFYEMFWGKGSFTEKNFVATNLALQASL